MPTAPLLLKSLSTVTRRHRSAHCPTGPPPTPSTLLCMTQLFDAGVPCPCSRTPLAAHPHTYMHAPPPRPQSAAAHPDKLTYMLALPPRPPPLLHTQIYIRTCVPYPRARPPLAAHPDTHTNIPALHPDIHSFGTPGSVCFTPTHTYVRCIHALQSGVAVGTPSCTAGSLCAVGGTNPSTTNAANTASP